MKPGRHTALLLASTAVVVILLGLSARSPITPPPTVTLLRSDPIDLVDDEGSELQLLTIRISNTHPKPAPYDPRNNLYILTSTQDFHVRRDGEWRLAQNPGNTQHSRLVLFPGTARDILLLAPTHSMEGRLRCRFAGPSAATVVRYDFYRWMDRLLPRSLFAVFDRGFSRWVSLPVPEHQNRLPWNEAEWDLNLAPALPSPPTASSPSPQSPPRATE